VGGKGYDDLAAVESQHIVALCDVDWGETTRRAVERWPEARRYQDFREMLDKEPDLDAVMIATPDHTHAVISLEAMRRGKHVYTEKPLTHTVREAQMLAEAAARHGVATQMGNQGQAEDGPRRLREMIWDGAIGPVREAHVWTDRPIWPQAIGRPPDGHPVPETLNWDLFLGPAPWRPYHPAYHPFVWRGWWDFGTGALGDIACHALDPVFRALKLGYPLTVQAVSSPLNPETFPQASMVTYTFPARGEMPPMTLTWYDGGLRPPRPRELEPDARMGDSGALYVGDGGMILNGLLHPKSLREQYEPPAPSIPSSPGHYQEWLDACRGGPEPGSSFAWAGPLTETVLMGNIALRMNMRKDLDCPTLMWDAEGKAFSNLPEANEFLTKPYREGWEILI
jgi:predicted dehydrogenase